MRNVVHGEHYVNSHRANSPRCCSYHSNVSLKTVTRRSREKKRTIIYDDGVVVDGDAERVAANHKFQHAIYFIYFA